MTIPASAPASRRRAAARHPETNGASGRPEASLRILETRILRGANYWAREPVIRMLVDLGSLESYPSNLIPGFSDALVGLLPSLDDHACSGRGQLDRGFLWAALGNTFNSRVRGVEFPVSPFVARPV